MKKTFLNTILAFGVGSSIAHYVTEHRQLQQSTISPSSSSSWQGYLMKGVMSYLTPKTSLSDTIEDHVRSQVDCGMEKAASALSILIEQVGTMVDVEYQEINQLINTLKLRRSQGEVADQQAAAIEKQSILAQTLVLLFSRNVSALILFTFLLIVVHSQTQIIHRYLILSQYHPFFAAMMTAELQQRFLTETPRDLLVRIAPMLMQRLRPSIDLFLKDSILADPYRDTTPQEMVEFFISLRDHIKNELDALQNGMAGLFALSVVPSPSSSSSDDPLALMGVELSRYVCTPSFHQSWFAVLDDFLLHWIKQIYHSPPGHRKHFKLFQLIPVLREFFLHHFGPKIVDDAIHFNPSAALTHHIPFQNQKFKEYLLNIASDISQQTYLLLDSPVLLPPSSSSLNPMSSLLTSFFDSDFDQSQFQKKN